MDVRLLGPATVVSDADGVPDAIQELWLGPAGRHRRRGRGLVDHAGVLAFFQGPCRSAWVKANHAVNGPSGCRICIAFRCYTRARMFFRGQIIGKYKILSTIGSGGFGTVYLAEDTWIDKKVALKVPHKQNLDFGELLREPRLLATLNHPNIVAILTAEKQENVFFIVMEFVPGETLESIIARDGALDLPRALDFTCQICNAVDHAHRQGVLHRDLRPANVLVGEHDIVKVADFGTSRFLGIAAHGTTVIGSPPY